VSTLPLSERPQWPVGSSVKAGVLKWDGHGGRGATAKPGGQHRATRASRPVASGYGQAIHEKEPRKAVHARLLPFGGPLAA
jgi:hypothetical protein